MCAFYVKMLLLLVVWLCGSVFGQSPRGRKCNDYYEFPCFSEIECISKSQWCDFKEDCSDGSDEYFCNGNVQCMEGQYRCRDGRCIPNSGRCDSFSSCMDYSDEEGCNDGLFFTAKNLTVVAHVSVSHPYANNSSADPAPVLTEYEQAVAAAADFLMDQRQADYGWGSSVATSRAVVALAFAEKIRPLQESDKLLMKKQLNIQLSLDLLQNPVKTLLPHLALYINALYATCQDPRSFQGLDLVKKLRTETDDVMSSNFSLPIVFLTLCVANEMDSGDIPQLHKIYVSSDRISTQALALKAWDCMARNREDRKEYTKYLKEFSSKMVNMTDENFDVYSTALFFQVYNAAVFKSNMSMLMRHRHEDGSFGDLLATYYAIPALLNATLMQLSCNVPNTEALTENTFNMYSGGKSVIYSLWIPTEAYVNARTVTVNYGEKASFYDIMRIAAFKDPTYRFMYDTEDRRIYSIADAPNDAETGKSWTLYQANGEIVVNTLKNLKEMIPDVGTIRPEAGVHYIFWLKLN